MWMGGAESLLNLWDIKRKPPQRAHAPPIDGFPIYDEPAHSDDEYLTDPDYLVYATNVIWYMCIQRYGFDINGNLKLEDTICCE